MGARLPWMKLYHRDLIDKCREAKLNDAQCWKFLRVIIMIDELEIGPADLKHIAGELKLHRTDRADEMMRLLIGRGLIKVHDGRYWHAKMQGFHAIGNGDNRQLDLRLELDKVVDKTVKTFVTPTSTKTTTSSPPRGERRYRTLLRKDGDAVNRAVDPMVAVYKTGKELLAKYGFSSSKAGALITRWKRDRTPEELMRVFLLAGRQERHNIVEYIAGALREKVSPMVSETQAHFDALREIIERGKNDEGTPPAAVNGADRRLRERPRHGEDIEPRHRPVDGSQHRDDPSKPQRQGGLRRIGQAAGDRPKKLQQ